MSILAKNKNHGFANDKPVTRLGEFTLLRQIHLASFFNIHR